MDNSLFDITVQHGPNRYDLAVSSEMSILQLMGLIESATGVEPSHQRIICKGKTLKDVDNLLSECHITPGAKIMLLGQNKPSVEDLETNMKFESVEDNMKHLENRLCDIFEQLDGISKGFVERKLSLEALGRIRKELLALNEQNLKLLETLDGIELQPGQSSARQRRKTLVQRIQSLMTQSDTAHEDAGKIIDIPPWRI